MRTAIDFEVRVVQEDLALQSRYEGLSLPLDPTVEFHTRAVRTTLELRRVLRDFVDFASNAPHAEGTAVVGFADGTVSASTGATTH